MISICRPMNLFSAWLFCVTAGPTLVQNLPSAVQTLCESWNNIHTNEFPNIGSWVSAASGPAVVWVQPQGLLAVGAVVALCHIQGCDVCVCVSLPSATPLPTTPSLQRATSAPCRLPTWAPSAARACPWQPPSSTPCCPWSGSPGISLCKFLCSTHCWVLCFVSSRADFRLCLSTTYRPGAASDLNLPVHSSKYQMNDRQFFCLRVVSPKVKLTEGNLFVK